MARKKFWEIISYIDDYIWGSYIAFFVLLFVILNLSKAIINNIPINYQSIIKIQLGEDQKYWKYIPQSINTVPPLANTQYCDFNNTKIKFIYAKSIEISQLNKKYYEVKLIPDLNLSLKQACINQIGTDIFSKQGYLFIEHTSIAKIKQLWLSDLTTFDNNIVFWILLFSTGAFLTHLIKVSRDMKISEETKNNVSSNSISDVIEDIKKQIYKGNKEDSSAKNDAMFAVGQVKINLKTVATNSNGGKIELKPVTLEQNVQSEKVQDITVELNPLKVFSDQYAKMKVEYKNVQDNVSGTTELQQPIEEVSQDSVEHENVQDNVSGTTEIPPQQPIEDNFKDLVKGNEVITIADFVVVKDKSYLWYKKGIKDETSEGDPYISDSEEHWINVENIEKIVISEIETVPTDEDISKAVTKNTVRIVSALINPSQDRPQKVCLINLSKTPATLSGWTIKCGEKTKNIDKDTPMNQNSTETIELELNTLDKSGGTIVLINAQNKVVHRVAYRGNIGKDATISFIPSNCN